MYKTIRIEEAQQLQNPIYIDLRSPGEFLVGHIIGAINISLFSNEERAEVGTTYTKIGVEQAKELGLKIASGKLPQIITSIQNYYKTGRPVIIYCWRGGMRSTSIATILTLMGVLVYQLIGGYKAYRRCVLDDLETFQINPRVIVLCGLTGVGKTSLLQLLAEKNIPIIDLEKLANHRGSVFGQVGLGKATTAQLFDATLLMKLNDLNDEPYIIIECESKRIGNIYLPNCLYQAIQSGTQILLQTDIEIRISRLIAEYTDPTNINNDAIRMSLQALSKGFGIKKVKQLIADFNQGHIRSVVRILLNDYYDPLYGYGKADQNNYSLAINCDNLETASFQIANYLGKIRG